MNLTAILPIAPSWNWNTQWPILPTLTVTLPIAPSWNWNLHFAFYGNQNHLPPNRTKLELKRMQHIFSISRLDPPNRTKLELKLFKCFKYCKFASCSQSHQAGIETLNLKVLFVYLCNSQSHQAGIETSNRWLSEAEATGYCVFVIYYLS